MNTLKKALKIVTYTFLGGFMLIILFLLYQLAPALWKHWVTYPGLEKERMELRATYQKPENYIQMPSFKGALHAHTYWSHDSRGTLPEILDGAKRAGLQFMFNADHKRHRLDSFPRGYHGVYDGILIESGTEHSSGLMVTPMDTLVIDWNKPESQIMKEIADLGGLVTYVHSEDEHDWDDPSYHAMEIYNIHTDVIDEGGLLPAVLNSVVNGKQYRDWTFREFYDEQTEILSHWDELNSNRKIVGIAGVDAHNNQSFRARYHEDGKVEWVGPNADTLVIREPNWIDRLLIGQPDKYGWAFKWEIDPYFNSYNFANTHVFCDSFSIENIKEHIKAGHAYISFESLAEGKGFQFFAQDNTYNIQAIMGDSIQSANVHQLMAVSPYPVIFQLYKDGEMIEEKAAGYEFSYDLKSPGNYRIVARVELDGDWIPWVYTNPIYIYE
ncbi:MAG: hypothetical protein RIC06_13045 [Cyclobacteriaceae bacterium]